MRNSVAAGRAASTRAPTKIVRIVNRALKELASSPPVARHARRAFRSSRRRQEHPLTAENHMGGPAVATFALNLAKVRLLGDSGTSRRAFATWRRPRLALLRD